MDVVYVRSMGAYSLLVTSALVAQSLDKKLSTKTVSLSKTCCQQQQGEEEKLLVGL